MPHAMTRALVRSATGAAGVLGLAYLGHVVTTWARYGQSLAPTGSNPLLDRFLPAPEVAERHQVEVAGTAEAAMAAARAIDFSQLPVSGLLFRVRAALLGDLEAPEATPPLGLAEGARAMGWGVLVDSPDAFVMGAVCRPWDADPGFRAVPPGEFATFSEPDLVKIVWAVGAAPRAGGSVAWTETRVATTDAVARSRFRLYWAAFSPGVRLIRWEMLRQVRSVAGCPPAPRPGQHGPTA